MGYHVRERWIIMAISEANKKELTLSLNTYKQPAELQGPAAWARLIVNLVWMRKGSYPSCPEMGVDIVSYDYDFFDSMQQKVQYELVTQVHQYYPEIPFSDCQITKEIVPGYAQPVVYMLLTFYYDGANNSVVVASTESNNIIDFGISM